MSSTRHGNRVVNNQIRELEMAVKQHLQNTWILVYYFADRRPGPIHALADQIQDHIDIRQTYQVSIHRASIFVLFSQVCFHFFL